MIIKTQNRQAIIFIESILKIEIVACNWGEYLICAHRSNVHEERILLGKYIGEQTAEKILEEIFSHLIRELVWYEMPEDKS